MSSSSPKRVLFAQFAAVAKALAHAHRLELLEQLAQGERSVEVLADRTRVSIANASQHLQHMRRAGLVAARRSGKFVFYRLADDAVLDLLASLRRIAERTVGRGRTRRAQLLQRSRQAGAISRPELMERLKAGIVTVLDVRPEDEFALGHLPGAINIPLSELERRLADLDPDRKSSPTAADRTACCPMKPWRCSGPVASRSAVWKTACRSGEPPGCRSRPVRADSAPRLLRDGDCASKA